MIFWCLASCWKRFRKPSSVNQFEHECCPICLEEEDGNSRATHYVQPCGHLIHEQCLLQWVVYRHLENGQRHPLRCVLCQTEVRAILTRDVLFPIGLWKRKALLQRFEERFMRGCFLYVFFKGDTFRSYLSPSTTVRQWKLAVIRFIRSLYEKEKIPCVVYEAARYSMLTMSMLYVREGHRYTVCGGPLYPLYEMGLMFCKSTCLTKN